MPALPSGGVGPRHLGKGRNMETTAVRTARISTAVGIKRNLGNYESLEFRKCIEVEVAYAEPSCP